ncbi:MAG: hypothetical protein GC136_10955, partial [Alphaproteobacteria bacterium]|nr:hypothetical protein [Alphaproteobacteria bacterium]
MIELLGPARFYALLVLGLITGALGFLYYSIVAPMETQSRAALNQTISATQQKNDEIANIRDELENIKKRKVDFDVLKARGFFDLQNRIYVQQYLDSFKAQTSLIRQKFEVSPAAVLSTPEGDKIEHVLLNSPIKVSIDAIDDVDIYNFIELVRTKFPGDPAIFSVTLRQTQKPTLQLLNTIAMGTQTPLVQAEMVFNWRSLATKQDIANPARLGQTAGS